MEIENYNSMRAREDELEEWASRYPRDEDDSVNHPAHYCQGGLEMIDVIKAFTSHDGFMGFCIGNVFKYVGRYRNKGGIEDLKKARWYLDKAIGMEGSNGN